MTERTIVEPACLSCGRDEHETPLLILALAAREARICPQCLPALIHHPDRLAGKLTDLVAKK
jgi:hypothetical protein